MAPSNSSQDADADARTEMHGEISLQVEAGNALKTTGDVLVLKYAQALYGVDAAVVSALEAAHVSIPKLPEPGESRLIQAQGAVAAKAVLFLGVPELFRFDYTGIREF